MEQTPALFNDLAKQSFIKRVSLDLALAASNSGCFDKLLLGRMDTFCGIAGNDQAAFLQVAFQPQATDYAKRQFGEKMKEAGFITLPHGTTGTEFNLFRTSGTLEMDKMRHGLRIIHGLGLIPSALVLTAATAFGVRSPRLDMEAHERMTGDKWQTICDEGKGASHQRVCRTFGRRPLTRVKKADAAPQTLA